MAGLLYPGLDLPVARRPVEGAVDLHGLEELRVSRRTPPLSSEPAQWGRTGSPSLHRTSRCSLSGWPFHLGYRRGKGCRLLKERQELCKGQIRKRWIRCPPTIRTVDVLLFGRRNIYENYPYVESRNYFAHHLSLDA